MYFTKPCPVCKEVIDVKVGLNNCPKCNKEFLCLDDISERIFLDSLKGFPKRRVK